LLYDLPSSAFTPPPKVNSAVVYFKPKALADDSPSFEAVERVTASAFNQRRKMIRSSMKAYMPAIEALGIDSQKRAENLSVKEYLDIASFCKLK
ncbi:MAG: 16S rRNA (adenine(1518)-N(6)/adenine(1519)-N(6))-dimethyltransferase, partial [Alphaproteobacteria bacterium]|nr:16S rRNA (adenine(1518)-N(6)/adenine(1519)-N(6))-dimethyltransferase [Alphaproteobacteria bacterium]